jgi:hypothetical protein
MTSRFEAGWLAAREPFDEAALDPGAIAAIRTWTEGFPSNRPIRVVDLGSGTGVALRRATTWLTGRPIVAAKASWRGARSIRIRFERRA